MVIKKIKIGVILLSLIILIGVLGVVSAVSPVEDAIIASADRLVETQNNDGGWDWGTPDDDFGDVSPKNTIGVTAQGVLDAYKLTATTEYLDTTIDAYDYMVVLVGSDERMRGPDIPFLVELSEVMGSSVYADLAKTRYQAALTKQGGGTATGLAEFIRDGRIGQGWQTLVAWDINLYVQGALALDRYYSGEGFDNDAADMAEVIYNYFYVDDPGFEFNPEQAEYWLSHTGAIEAFATTGLHADKIESLVTSLKNSQDVEDGCFSGTQVTAYAIMALLNVNEKEVVLDASNCLITSQDTNGGWIGDSGEYTEVGSEAVQALFDFGDIEGPIFGKTSIEPGYPNCEDTLITINSEITDESGVAFAELSWRYDGGNENHKAPQFEDGLWITKIYIESEDGREITYHIKATDNIGNERWSSNDYEHLFTYDCSPPETTKTYGTPFYNDGVNDYITSDTEITLTCNGVISGCKEIHYSINGGSEKIVLGDETLFTITGDDRTHTIVYYSIDNAGNPEDPKTTEVILDNSKPEVELQSLDEFYNSIPIDLVFTYSDSGSGIKEYKVYKKRLGVDTNFVDVTSITCDIVDDITTCEFEDGTKDGKFEFKVEVIDNVENSQDSNIVSTTLDRAGPDEVNLENPSNGVYINSQPLLSWLEATDNDDNLNPTGGPYGISGIKEYELDLDGSSIILNELSYQTFGLDESQYTWKVKAKDNAGNAGTWSETRTFIIDLTPPKISNVDVDPKYVGSIYVAGTITASATITDENGVDSVTFSLGEKECDAIHGADDTWACDIDTTTLSDGEYILVVSATDVAQSQNVDSSLNVIVDNTAPTTTIISPKEGSLFASDFNVNVSDSDDGSGLDYCKYRIFSNDILTRDWTLRDCDDDVTLSVGLGEDCKDKGIDVCRVEVKATDNLENENVLVGRTFSIDFSPPEINIVAPNTNGTEIDDMAYYLVKANVDDLVSEVKSVMLNLLNTTEIILENVPMTPGTYGYEYLMRMWELEAGEYTLEVTAEDNAGNSATDVRTFIIEDNIAPTKIISTNNKVPVETGGTVSFDFNVTVRGSGKIVFGMDDIAGLTPSQFNARIVSNPTAAVGGPAPGFVDAEVLLLEDLDPDTPNIQGSFTLYLDIPADMVPGTYSINYYIDVP